MEVTLDTARKLEREAAQLQIGAKADFLVERLGSYIGQYSPNTRAVKGVGFVIKKDHARIWIEADGLIVFWAFQSNYNTDGSPKTETYLKGPWVEALNKLFEEESDKQLIENLRTASDSLLRHFGIMR